MPVFTCPSGGQAARDDAAFNELIAQLDDEDDDPIGHVWRHLPDDDSDG